MGEFMTKEEMFNLMNSTMVMHLATVEDGQPHVRGMLLYKADKNGIIFHTGSFKDVFKQIEKNPKVEVCFNSNDIQLRVKGIIEEVNDTELKKEIFAHPTRKFLHQPLWLENNIEGVFRILRIKNCEATTWTMKENFDKTEWVKITE